MENQLDLRLSRCISWRKVGRRVTKLRAYEDNEKMLRAYMECSSNEDKRYIEDDIIRNNDKFIYYLCNKFKTPHLTIEEKHSLGMFGMMKAIRSFDLDKEIKFATYASTVINNEILMQLRKDKNKHLLVSLETIVHSDNSSGNELRVEDLVPDARVDIERDLVNRAEVEEMIDIAQNTLKPVELTVFHNMLHGKDGLNQRQLGIQMGYTQTHISRTRKGIKQKMKKAFLQREEKAKRLLAIGIVDKQEIENMEEEVIDMSKLTVSNYKKCRERGWKDKRIALEYNMSVESVYQFKSVNGLTKKHKNPGKRRTPKTNLNYKHPELNLPMEDNSKANSQTENETHVEYVAPTSAAFNPSVEAKEKEKSVSMSDDKINESAVTDEVANKQTSEKFTIEEKDELIANLTEEMSKMRDELDKIQNAKNIALSEVDSLQKELVEERAILREITKRYLAKTA